MNTLSTLLSKQAQENLAHLTDYQIATTDLTYSDLLTTEDKETLRDILHTFNEINAYKAPKLQSSHDTYEYMKHTVDLLNTNTLTVLYLDDKHNIIKESGKINTQQLIFNDSLLQKTLQATIAKEVSKLKAKSIITVFTRTDDSLTLTNSELTLIESLTELYDETQYTDNVVIGKGIENYSSEKDSYL